MNDTPERALHEAESWLVSAKHTLMDAEEEDAKITVCCAQAIHALIRANDALSLKSFGHKSTRHEDAAALFAKLVREKKLPDKAIRFKDLISTAMRDKSGADYGKGSFSYEDAKLYVERTENFITMVKDVLKI